MPGKAPLYYWDTCLFLAWIKDEERPTGEMAGVREIVSRVKRREVVLMTSVLTLTEVLQSRIPAGMNTLFTGLLRRFEVKGIDIKIARLAHDLRDYYTQRAPEFANKTLSTPDALHLATAIMYRADEFHTFDLKGSQRSLGLLPLSGNVGGNKLTICKPEARNPELDLKRG
jgi:predicted nucleic acid-binding protein